MMSRGMVDLKWTNMTFCFWQTQNNEIFLAVNFFFFSLFLITLLSKRNDLFHLFIFLQEEFNKVEFLC